MILDWIAGKQVYDTKGQEIVEFFFKDNGKLYSKKKSTFETPKSILNDIQDTQFARTELEDLLGVKTSSHILNRPLLLIDSSALQQTKATLSWISLVALAQQRIQS